MPEEQEEFDPRSELAIEFGDYPYFYAKPVTNIKNRPGTWDSFEIGVFQHNADGSEQHLGSYTRNYSFLSTFFWFRRGERHFALYSKDYTATRIMEIFPGSGWKDIGGEDRQSNGFCPVEFYVPDERYPVFEEFEDYEWDNLLASFPPGSTFQPNAKTHRGKKKLRNPDGSFMKTKTKSGYEDWTWGEESDYRGGWVTLPPNYGFVAGCHWGDDSSWKIQYLDLSRAEEGIIKRDARFGYIELPENLSLKKAISSEYSHENGRVTIAIATSWDLQTGKLCYPDGLCSREDHRPVKFVGTTEDLLNLVKESA